MATAFEPGWDVLIIARPAIVTADYASVDASLQQLLVRAGIVPGTRG